MSDYLSTPQLLGKWKQIADSNQPHASIRIGDGESTVAAHEEILTMDFINKEYPWVQSKDLSYCGVTLPNADARRQLVNALRQADFLGILSQTENWMFKPLSDMVVQYYGLNPQSYFYAFDNYVISTLKDFYDFFRTTSVLLVGSKAKCLKEVLEKRYGWTGIVGSVNCPDWTYLESAKKEMDQYQYRMALISAGIPGKILTAYAKFKGNVGIDFGCGTDMCLESDAMGLYTWEMKTGPKRTYICR